MIKKSQSGTMLNYAYHGIKYRYRHKQKPAPTHAEIMNNLWYVDGTVGMFTVIESFVSVAGMVGDKYILSVPVPMKQGDMMVPMYVQAYWFIGRESVDIPPEV